MHYTTIVKWSICLKDIKNIIMRLTIVDDDGKFVVFCKDKLLLEIVPLYLRRAVLFYVIQSYFSVADNFIPPFIDELRNLFDYTSINIADIVWVYTDCCFNHLMLLGYSDCISGALQINANGDYRSYTVSASGMQYCFSVVLKCSHIEMAMRINQGVLAI